MSSGKPLTTDDLFTLFYGNEAAEQPELPQGACPLVNSSPSQQAASACECGTSTVLGKDDNPELHSDWCPVYRKRRDL